MKKSIEVRNNMAEDKNSKDYMPLAMMSIVAIVAIVGIIVMMAQLKGSNGFAAERIAAAGDGNVAGKMAEWSDDSGEVSGADCQYARCKEMCNGHGWNSNTCIECYDAVRGLCGLA